MCVGRKFWCRVSALGKKVVGNKADAPPNEDPSRLLPDNDSSSLTTTPLSSPKIALRTSFSSCRALAAASALFAVESAAVEDEDSSEDNLVALCQRVHFVHVLIMLGSQY
jgi:hypothetical protein